MTYQSTVSEGATFSARQCVQPVTMATGGGEQPPEPNESPEGLGTGHPTVNVASVKNLSIHQNIYIGTDKAEGNWDSQDLCRIQAGKKLESHCSHCNEPLSDDCKHTKHERHETDDLTSGAARSKRPDLLSYQDRLERAVSTVRGQVAGRQEELRALQQKTRALEADIERRHQLVVNTARRWRHEAIQSLHSVTADIEGDVRMQLNQRQRQLDKLLAIQRQLQLAIRSGTDDDVIAIAEEMESGRGSPSEVDKMTSQQKYVTVRPVLQFNETADVMVEKTRDYLGSVRKMEMTVTQDDVTVEKFTCTEDPGLDVFSLCHKDTDPPVVIVSYDNKTLLQPDMPMKTFRETGECVTTGRGKEVGRLTYRRHAKGRAMYAAPLLNGFTTYSKSATAAHFQLDNKLTGQANIKMVKVLSTDPFKPEAQVQFSINVGPHRAFDVDDTEQYCVLVEEAQPPAVWRSVRMYRRPQKTAVDTYTPPTAAFQPSDLYFHMLGGQKILLICDELNDAIHVVRVEDDHMTFQRYLCAGCPLLVQPTAITVDLSGRLWVGCRGGRVLTLTVGEGGGVGRE